MFDRATPPLPPIERVDVVPSELERAMEVLFGTTELTADAAAAGPFGSYEALLDWADARSAALPVARQRALLAGHPRLGADPASLPAGGAARREQRRWADDEGDRAELRRLGDEYESKHGFRFVTRVGGRGARDVLEELRWRLAQPAPAELARARSAVVEIARDRAGRRTSVEVGGGPS